MKTPIAKEIKTIENYYIEFTDEELAALKMEKGQKYSWEVVDGGVKLTPYVKVDLDISSWDKEILEFLIEESCTHDISVNDVITNILEKVINYDEI